MNMDVEKRLQQINIENYIWVIYLIIIGFSFISNELEKDYFVNHNLKSKEQYRKINIMIFSVITIIYLYFVKESYESVKEKNKSETLKKYDFLSFIASSLVFISGIIFLYIAIDDKDIEEEIAFN